MNPPPNDDAPTHKTWWMGVQMPPKATVADLLHWCHEQGHDPADVRLNGGATLNWLHTETDAERRARLQREADAEQRHRDFIQRRYAELFGQTQEADRG